MLQIFGHLTVNQEAVLVAEAAKVHDAQLSLMVQFHRDRDL